MLTLGLTNLIKLAQEQSTVEIASSTVTGQVAADYTFRDSGAGLPPINQGTNGTATFITKRNHASGTLPGLIGFAVG